MNPSDKNSNSAAEFMPAALTLTAMRSAVQKCEGCDLYVNATQAVFGEGRKAARIILIGEQPGDAEDRRGRPFVGPAGLLLDRALEDAGIDRSGVYITNAVKHFKFEERGKRRIHKKPSASEVRACQPWLEGELRAIKPSVLVCLGATAAQSVFGPAYRVTKERGRFIEHPWAKHATSTVHPSAILRAPDEERRHLEYARFVDDLKKVRSMSLGG
ncbi:MAG TPA: UdgX family uracil-DNA binding protein [Bryobacteraceae bacterium]|nr:UdgX family uracil-DNA binding protein [Bryobacteraceae bacterium]